ncbi:MAG: adenosylmethionine decarboxylase [Chloroflexi bacterium]|nr:adenosylmethionine decarboxylase [Chloroflexota bacterium]MCH2532138.1 adenosylmethionine decarboxylase [Dehalococcoidia bacterium]HCH35487.1 adenosylmethionine decarboxylase [Dehalococcoidia bacterium]
MKALGRHVLLELRTCNPELLDDLEFLKKVLLEAAVKTGATVIGEIFHQFSPQGVTGVVAIAESHLCIHTWPEFGYAGVDIFTCGENFDPTEAAKLIIDELESKDPEITEVKRGLLDSWSQAFS